jgi:hypothetical protein
MKTRATANDAAVPSKASVKPTSALRKGLSLPPRTLRVFPSRSWTPVMARSASFLYSRPASIREILNVSTEM